MKVNQSVDLIKGGRNVNINQSSPLKAHTLKIKIDRKKLHSDLEDLKISNIVMKYD